MRPLHSSPLAALALLGTAVASGCSLIASPDEDLLNGTGGGVVSSTSGSTSSTSTGPGSSSSGQNSSTSTGDGGGGSPSVSSGGGEGGDGGQGGAGGQGGSGGQGGAGGQGGSGGQGGQGGGCTEPSDCPDPVGECVVAACDDGTCGEAFVAPGTETIAQEPGDCQVVVCDGKGGTEDEIDDLDVADDGNDCTIESCEAGVPGVEDAPLDAPCGVDGDLFCDGAGVCQGCTVPEQCGADTDCATPTCDAGVCGTDFEPDGTVAASGQTDGDCREFRCDGDGNAVEEIDDTDEPDDDNDCTDDVCADGEPDNVDLDPGEACDGGVCDGDGACVACVEDLDCGAENACTQQTCNPDNTCAAPTFTPEGTEITNGAAGDCRNDACGANGAVLTNVADDTDFVADANTCTIEGCNNGAQTTSNAGSGVDCTFGGGNVCDGDGNCVECISPAQCDPGETCLLEVCVAQPLCTNGIQDPGETDTDCGGPTCADCPNGDSCLVAGDCVSGYCNPLNVCATPTCSDTIRNQDETDVECGGAICGNCANGDDCLIDADCTSDFCDPVTDQCAAPVCGNGVLEGSEACDDDDTDPGDGCDGSCVEEVGFNCVGEPSDCDPECGDGLLRGGELCDDDDLDPGDGCSATCTPEPGYNCTGEPSVCTIPGQSCAAPLVIGTTPFAVTGSTFAATYGENGVFGNGTSCLDPTTGGGADLVLQITVNPGQTVRLSEHGTTFDAILHILTSPNCTAGTACVASADGNANSVTETNGVTYTNSTGAAQTVYLVVESWDAGSGTVPYDVRVDRTSCGDGIVNGSEQCDDANSVDPGCSATCTIEAGFACDGTAPSTCYSVAACTTAACYAGPCTGGTVVSGTATGLPVVIPDGVTAGINSTITIPATAGTIRNVVVGWDVTHAFDSDLDFFLLGPTGAEIDVCSDNGGSGDNFVDTFVRDRVTTAITAGIAPFTGVFRPETSFASYVGTSPTGNWRLRVRDQFSDDEGSLTNFEIAMCVIP